MTDELDIAENCKIHLLDVGKNEYGDAVLCQFGDKTVLIDGAHPGDYDGTPGHLSIPDQIGNLLGKEKPYPIDLLIITHAHQDHIGCLPRLIEEDILQVDCILAVDPQLGWGRAGKDDQTRDANESVVRLTAALREEIHSERGTQDSVLEQFITDAVSLETRYKRMLEILATKNTKVIKLGNPTADLEQLEAAFSDIKLKILGPSNAHLLECAELIGEKTRDSIDSIDSFLKRDTQLNEIDAYRRLAEALYFKTDSSDSSGSRPGPLINLQSIVTQFEYAGHKFLFTGDFQFADPQTKNSVIVNGVAEIKAKIKAESPYSFVKLSHHGSDNAFSEEMLTDLGDTKIFGLCAGQESTHHPARKVLNLLNEHTDTVKWARTDRNGLVTLIYKKDEKDPEIRIEKGVINDAKPNFLDVTASVFATPSSTMSPSNIPNAEKKPSAPLTKEETGTTASEKGAVSIIPSKDPSQNFIEITAKIPTTVTEIEFSGNFKIKFQTTDRNKIEETPNHETLNPKILNSDSPLLIGGGRAVMKDLLFVTNSAKLEENIGQGEMNQILNAFQNQQIPILAEIPKELKKSSEAADYVQRKLIENPGIKGVVIIGGYDVVPSQILDCLPTNLRSVLPPNDDPDNFIVWSDDIYGDRDGDGLPEIPVSRIPDGKSASLVFKALQSASPTNVNAKFGIRNIARPFAIDIFNKIGGSERLLVSKDTVFDQHPPLNLTAEQVYFMLHGDYRDTARFWGEDTPLNREAFHTYNLPETFRGIAFAGCCWGALTVDTPAGRLHPQRPFNSNTVESSIALGFLERGANAFIGCTGAHYSPTEPPFNYFGGPLHSAFWDFYNAGFSPSPALFNAKLEYIKQMPHGRQSVIQQAIEYKILRQFTCLGLGW